MKEHVVKPGSKVKLADHDPACTKPYESEDETTPLLNELREELAELQGLLYADDRYALLVVLQGMDASGKDGTIRHVMHGMTPLGCHVTAFKAPTSEELEHDFLWRIHMRLPRRGEIGIFNRSHYEDVLIARVHDLVPKKVWKERYKQINRFERLLVDNNTIILKFFLHMSKEEQKERFLERLNKPTKYWKFNLTDIEERKFWPQYQRAYEVALSKCSTEWAPWTIVPADKKWYRNLVVAQTLIKTLKDLKMRYPPPRFDRSKVVIE